MRHRGWDIEDEKGEFRERERERDRERERERERGRERERERKGGREREGEKEKGRERERERADLPDAIPIRIVCIIHTQWLGLLEPSTARPLLH
jgi:hypothetical protein